MRRGFVYCLGEICGRLMADNAVPENEADGVLFQSRGRMAITLRTTDIESSSNPNPASHCGPDQTLDALRSKESNIEDEMEVPINAVEAAATKAAFVSANRMYSFVYRCTSHRKSLVSRSGLCPLSTFTLYPRLSGKRICFTFPRASLR